MESERGGEVGGEKMAKGQRGPGAAARAKLCITGVKGAGGREGKEGSWGWRALGPGVGMPTRMTVASTSNARARVHFDTLTRHFSHWSQVSLRLYVSAFC